MTLPHTAVAVGKLAPGVGNLGLREQHVRPPDEGEATIEVIAAGICGTDLHIADDEFPSNPPVTMGHEVTGEVVAVGEGVTDSWLGVRVTVETYFFYCNECDSCRSGSPNLCDLRQSIGSHVDGGFTRWLTLPSRNLHRLPERVGRYAGALAEPLACVANCLFDPPIIDAGDRVMVIGPGTMGVLTAQAARAAGGHVTLVGLAHDRARLAIAESLGIHTLVVGEQDPATPDVVCDCSGSEAGAQMGLGAIRKGGKYIQVGIFGRNVSVPLDNVLYRELPYTSGFASTPKSWRRAILLLEQGLVALDPLVTRVVPLAEWEGAFEATRAGAGMKYVLDPRQSEGAML